MTQVHSMLDLCMLVQENSCFGYLLLSVLSQSYSMAFNFSCLCELLAFGDL